MKQKDMIKDMQTFNDKNVLISKSKIADYLGIRRQHVAPIVNGLKTFTPGERNGKYFIHDVVDRILEQAVKT